MNQLKFNHFKKFNTYSPKNRKWENSKYKKIRNSITPKNDD